MASDVSFEDAMANLEVGNAPVPAPIKTPTAVKDQSFEEAMAEVTGESKDWNWKDAAKDAYYSANNATVGMLNLATGKVFRDQLRESDVVKGIESKLPEALQASGQNQGVFDYTPHEQIIPEGTNRGLDLVNTASRIAGEEAPMLPLAAGKVALKPLMTAFGLSSAGGAVAKEGAEELGAGETGQLVAEIAGSTIAPNPAGIVKAGVTGVRKLWNMTGGKIAELVRNDKAGDLLKNATPEQIKLAIQRSLAEAYPDDARIFDDPDTANAYRDKLVNEVQEAIARGEKGTVGQLTGDRGILQFEDSVVNKAGDRPLQQVMDSKNAGLQAEVQAGMPTTTGNADEALPAINQSLQGEQRALTADAALQADEALVAPKNVLNKAIEQQKLNTANIEASPLPTTQGKKLTQTLQAKADSVKESASALWKKAMGTDASGKITYNAGKFKTEINKVLDAIPDKNVSQALRKAFKSTLDDLDSYTGEVSLDLLSDEISKLATKSMDGTASGRQAGIMKEYLYDALENTGKDSASRREAAAAWRDYMTKYGEKSVVGRTLKAKNAGTGKALTSDLDKLDEVIATGDPASIEAAKDFIRSEFNQTKMAGGEIDANVRAFYNKYAGQLDQFPDLKKELDTAVAGGGDVVDAQKAMTTAEKQAEALRKQGASDAQQIAGSTPAKIAEYSPNQTQEAIEKVFKGTNPDRAATIKKLFDAAPTAKAKENLKAAFVRDAENTVGLNGKMNSEGLKRLKARSKIYKEAGIFTEKEIENLERGVAEGQKIFLHDAAKLADIPPREMRLQQAIASILGARVGASLFGMPLVGAGIGKKAFTQAAKKLSTEKIDKLAYELMMNPEKFTEVTKKYGSGLQGADAGAMLDEMADIIFKPALATGAVNINDEIVGDE